MCHRRPPFDSDRLIQFFRAPSSAQFRLLFTLLKRLPHTACHVLSLPSSHERSSTADWFSADSDFINMPITNGHSSSDESVRLPVINISETTPEVGRQMIDAATHYGFLYIDTRGTDFTPEIVERQFESVGFLSSLLVEHIRPD